MVNALSNIESSFDNIKSVTDEKFVWKPGWFLNQLHHPQGIAVTKDKYYISHNGIYEGYIYVFDRKTSEALPGEWKTVGGAGYNHPGTIQIANHLLLATLQQQTSQGYPGTYVTLHDLNHWDAGPCTLLKNDKLSGKGFAGIVCVKDDGKTQKYIAISDHNIFEINVSNGQISHTNGSDCSLTWDKPEALKTVDEQCVNLVVDKNGTVYAITAGTNKNNDNNVLALYQMEVQERTSLGTIKKAHMAYKKNRVIITCSNWMTCSAGTGIEIQGESIIVFVTSKPGCLSTRLSIGVSKS